MSLTLRSLKLWLNCTWIHTRFTVLCVIFFDTHTNRWSSLKQFGVSNVRIIEASNRLCSLVYVKQGNFYRSKCSSKWSLIIDRCLKVREFVTHIRPNVSSCAWVVKSLLKNSLEHHFSFFFLFTLGPPESLIPKVCFPNSRFNFKLYTLTRERKNEE